MTTIKKRFLIAACALAFLSAGAFALNTASAADMEERGRDYHIALHEGHPGDPLPPPEYRHYKKHRRAHAHHVKAERRSHHKPPICVTR